MLGCVHQDTVQNFDPYANEGAGEGTGYVSLLQHFPTKVFMVILYGPNFGFAHDFQISFTNPRNLHSLQSLLISLSGEIEAELGKNCMT